MTIADLPAVNACLNGTSAILLTAGYRFIRRGNRIAHRNCMVAAFATSTLFLVCYLTYHFNVKAVTRFENPQWFRPIYLTILLTHTLLAVVVVPLVLMTLNRAVKQRFELHKKIARWTWPIWMYVSVTGVVIYLLLYQIFPQR
jgi:putative membrane protein